MVLVGVDAGEPFVADAAALGGRSVAELLLCRRPLGHHSLLEVLGSDRRHLGHLSLQVIAVPVGFVVRSLQLAVCESNSAADAGVRHSDLKRRRTISSETVDTDSSMYVHN